MPRYRVRYGSTYDKLIAEQSFFWQSQCVRQDDKFFSATGGINNVKAPVTWNDEKYIIIRKRSKMRFAHRILVQSRLYILLVNSAE